MVYCIALFRENKVTFRSSMSDVFKLLFAKFGTSELGIEDGDTGATTFFELNKERVSSLTFLGEHKEVLFASDLKDGKATVCMYEDGVFYIFTHDVMGEKQESVMIRSWNREEAISYYKAVCDRREVARNLL